MMQDITASMTTHFTAWVPSTTSTMMLISKDSTVITTTLHITLMPHISRDSTVPHITRNSTANTTLHSTMRELSTDITKRLHSMASIHTTLMTITTTHSTDQTSGVTALLTTPHTTSEL